MDDAPGRLECLYRETGADILAYFRRRHRDPETAEDLLQETFVAAMRNSDRVIGSASPRAYLFGIARYLSVEVHRRARPLEELPPEIPAEPEPCLDERMVLMREAIAVLPDQQREILELRLQHELSYDEIADVLEIPVGTVRSRLHHAVARLRQTMSASKQVR